MSTKSLTWPTDTSGDAASGGETSIPGGANRSRFAQFVRRRNFTFWVALAVVLLVWQIVGSRLGKNLIVVPPSAIGRRGYELWTSGQLGTDLVTSGQEFAVGFVLGALGGVVVGLLTGNWKAMGRLLDPFINAAYAMPIIAIAPIFIIALGLGEASKVAVVGLACIFPIGMTTAAGVRATEDAYKELARSFHLSQLMLIRKVLLPSSVPYIVSGLRVGSGRALTAVLAAELFGARAGVGLLILNSASNFDTAAVYVGIVIFALAGIIVSKLFELLEGVVAPWRRA